MYMNKIKMFPTSETKIFHLYDIKYHCEKIDGEWYSYTNQGFKKSYYRVDYPVRLSETSRSIEHKFCRSLRLANEFAKQKHKEFIC